ncbi:stringent starvation protein A [Candidatus Phycosocius bacilliformis]|uniref:Stringent starvation protein A n=1 Tax=Candidatus Phycosocius bacilliformis TaxID=1445552 RepID=A0A2P2EC72_9PROT|nr:glutathione S-transferase family protein [Candidatus Phycosocius bacilliformis]GBF58631.1 stringent starvation protein A [Candidatus Phycosocius bacilliformis]
MLLVHARTLDPLSRAVRLALGEKRAVFHVREVAAFEADAQLAALSPDGMTPVLVDDSWGHGATISEALAIFEYLEDLLPTPPLLPGGPLERAHVRTLTIRAMRTLGPVVDAVVHEKARKALARGGPPEPSVLRTATQAASRTLDEIGRAAEAEGWIGGKKLSIADMVAAAHFSVLDFLDAVSWASAPAGKDWYARLKQRPAFRPLLGDLLPGVSAPAHYADLDF